MSESTTTSGSDSNMNKECCTYLTGKTIAKVTNEFDEEFDDRDQIKITFTDGSCIWISAYYGSYTGKSRDEYPAYLFVSDLSIDKD